MDNKRINFHLSRYHLLPISTRDAQISLFEDKKLTYEELREKKNSFFKEVLHNLPNSKSHSNPLKLFQNDDNYYLFKLANKKITTITQNFENISVDDEPYVYVIINNNNNVQRIAISENFDAFSSTDVVKNILRKVFQKDLLNYGLSIEIEQEFNSVDFWKYIQSHKDQITYINFEYIKPNLANISGSLPKDFKNFSDNVNSHESHLTIKAPTNGVLENIDKGNKDINGLVDYTSKGGGSIKLKVKNFRKQLSTKENPVILQMDQIDIEGAPDQVIKMYQALVNENN